MAADYVTNVNLDSSAAVGIYAANKSFKAMDNISIMCRNLCRYVVF